MSNAELITEKLRKKLGEKVTNELLEIIDKYPITNKYRLAHLLGQSAHESQNFTRYSENLNYGVEGLLATFSKFRNNKAKARELARQPERIANFVYADLHGNGNEASGDGWNFRGRGWIGLTFKGQYEKLSAIVGEDLIANPDLVVEKYAAASAGFYFNERKIWTICDGGINDVTIKAVTKLINPALDKLDRRIALTKSMYSLLS